MAIRSAKRARNAASRTGSKAGADERAADLDMMARTVGRGGSIARTHIFASLCVDASAQKLDLPGCEQDRCGARVSVLCHFRETGKAVRTGHSCAAVSHHRLPPLSDRTKASRLPPPASGERGQSQSATSVAGEGGSEDATTRVAAHMRSPNICSRETHASGANCAGRSRKLHRKQ